MRIRSRGGTLLLFAALVSGLAAPAVAQDEGYVGASDCAACHEGVVAEFQKTSHAIGTHWDAEKACESCHGPGAKHVDSNDPADLRQFGALSPRERSEVCLTCHTRAEHQFRGRYATHTLNEISCIDCHSPHSKAPQLLEARGVELCSKCHAAIAAQFDMPRSHPLPDSTEHLANRGIPGPPGCEGCHQPHVEAWRTSRMLRGAQGSVNCTSCHIEQAGPFVYPHDVGIVDGCQSCHTVHGSTNRHLLNHERQVNLCYECHAGTQTPTFHSAPRFLNEKCTACHTAIHGSNTHPFFLEE